MTTKKWEFEIIENNGDIILNRKNTGFTIYELLGICRATEIDLLKQIEIMMTPKKTNRYANGKKIKIKEK